MKTILVILSVFYAILPPKDIVDDIYGFLSETETINYEDLQEQLIEIHQHPINLNEATAEDLERLRFLSGKQIDNILLYVETHPMDSLSELQLIPDLQDYEIRDLLPFVCVRPKEVRPPIYAKEVFKYAQHELLARTDARYIEDPKRDQQSDPIYSQFRYKFNYRNQVQAAFTLRRPTGCKAQDLLYGGYICLKDIGHLRSLVLGNYQAHYGLGLVMTEPFRNGRQNYVMNVGLQPEGIRKYASVDGQGLHGVGTSWRYRWLDISAWYSLTKENDSIRKHNVGLNLTAQYRRWKIGITAMENIYSDTLRYYYEHARYNQNYFRGKEQFVGGVNFRWNQGIVDVFGEVAAAQNKQRWGAGVTAGMRLTPIHDLGFILLYRYFSPHFDNTWGYAFSETSRINDENGLYIGTDIKRLKHWRFQLYGDIFYFSGIKYGIPYSPSWGYDAQVEAAYLPSSAWNMDWRFRARQKAKKDTYQARYRFNWGENNWQLRTELTGNIVKDSLAHLTYGGLVSQYVAYAFARVPLVLQLCAEGFYTPDWDNRIYQFEHDVLYAYSSTAMYGEGGRLYLNLRWKPIQQLSVYFKISETVYTKRWQNKQALRARTRTDVHLLLRATL